MRPSSKILGIVFLLLAAAFVASLVFYPSVPAAQPASTSAALTMKAAPAAPPSAESKHADIVSASLYGCEKFLRANSLVKVNEIVRSYELAGKKLREPAIEAWVGIDYRGGADGRLMWIACHYGEFGSNIALMDHETGLR